MTKSDAQRGAAAGSAESRGAATRYRLVDAAIRALAEHGWGDVTTRLVAEMASVNPALVHYHFGSVDVLLREAAVKATATVFEPVTRSLVDAPEAAVGMRAMIDAVAGIDPAAPESRATVEAIMHASRDPQLGEVTSATLADVRKALSESINRGQRAGTISSHRAPEQIATAVAALFDGLALHRMLDPGLDVRSPALALLENLLVEGP